MSIPLLEVALSLPFTDPVLIFSVVLFIIFFIPMILRRIRIPGLIGMIVIGAIVGPNGFNLLLRDTSIQLFGEVGLLYIMFLAALEIDLEDFKQNRGKSSIFGLFTFLIPMVIGFPVIFYLLGYPLLPAILIASIFSSHTLISYPIIGKYEITRNKAVNITVGGTMLTDIAALLILAIIVQMASGDIHASFWLKLGGFLVFFVLVIWQVIPRISRYFFKKEEDNIQQYIYTLGIVFLCAFLAQAGGLEAIIGAFLGGLALNKFIPKTSPLMNRISFIGNALFIPFFMISVGMLIDFKIFVEDPRTILVAGVITVLAAGTKYLAAALSGKLLAFSKAETWLMFGLSTAQAAATLAVVTVGYNIIISPGNFGPPTRLLDDAILNGAILMILVTCIISSLVVNRNARKIAESAIAPKKGKAQEPEENILMALSNPELIPEVMELAVLIKQAKKEDPLFALHVITDEEHSEEKLSEGKSLIEKAVKEAASNDQQVEPIVRFDYSIADGVIHSMREKEISDLIIGLDEEAYPSINGSTAFVREIVYKTNEAVMIYQPTQPLGTVENLVVAVPDHAEKETGFENWYQQLVKLCRESGTKVIFYASETTLQQLKTRNPKEKKEGTASDATSTKDGDENSSDGLPARYETTKTPYAFSNLKRLLGKDDLLVLIVARKNTVSYQLAMEEWNKKAMLLPNGFLIIYPGQDNYDPLNYFDLFRSAWQLPMIHKRGRRG